MFDKWRMLKTILLYLQKCEEINVFDLEHNS